MSEKPGSVPNVRKIFAILLEKQGILKCLGKRLLSEMSEKLVIFLNVMQLVDGRYVTWTENIVNKCFLSFKNMNINQNIKN